MPLEADSMSVTVAFSGGKDSTAAVLLLREQGYEVRALTMRLGLQAEEEKLARIEKLARVIEVPWQVIDLRQAFREKVLDYFLNAYRAGRTPNPCVLCNRHIKFGVLMGEMKRNIPGGFFASGHYADKVCRDGNWFLREPVDRRKSQIYFLAMVDPAVLAKVLFPIAALTISQVRKKVAGLPLANIEESQDVCFLQDETLASYLSRKIPKSFTDGDIIDVGGKKIGRHHGVSHFTVGQRRGTRHASDRRLYVVGRDLVANTVTLGDEHDLLSGSLTVTDPVFWRPLQAGEKLSVKIRYQLHGHEAEIAAVSDTAIRAVFKNPVRAVTPGQFGVFYDGDIIVAAGEIAAEK
ncbi:MAG: tRNA 2-thiouridine(34) synthase MnmA [Acidobacteria bacterium]|nr:tRNA 2-thiouridine(34) synthase MnmA [Acidobacteriota bacterium]MBU4307834.1 tRNA 2-thiouridine(34) synthase MnmA [Acidobacteriota bacterium]MBU4405098.1 tRNA 2-thiouridine(34) synthase MnmA [Acidobacteriota bacterium]MCG2810547.1 tRNA 2-thiouridine(34) synthase MnmA [Candidatus Aminicenantes bacterium]